MRIVFLILIAVPLTCFGVGLDSCHLEGRLNGKKVKLSWIYLQSEDVEGFGLNNSPIYGFCSMGWKGDHDRHSIYYMSCAPSRKGERVAYYETSKQDDSYVCKTGCGKNVVEKFKLICVGD
jgi:hypothetical protein